jgi:hypothetical protein
MNGFIENGIAGPQLAGRFQDAASTAAGPIIWMPPFIIAGAVCLVGAPGRTGQTAEGGSLGGT